MSSAMLVNRERANAASARLSTGMTEASNGVPDSSQLSYYARYFGDPVSRLFWQGPELWMGILPPYGSRFTDLMKSCVLDAVFAEHLIFGLEPVDEPIQGFDAVYRLDHTPRITYWHEWSPKMLRAATLRLFELLIELAERALTLRNPHAWNLLFDGSRFSYANPGSVVPLEAETFAHSYEKIARFFVRPLLLLENGYEHMAHRLTADVREGVLATDVRHLGCPWAHWSDQSGEHSILSFLKEVFAKIESLLCNSTGYRWGNYFVTDCDFSPGSSWSRKEETLEALLRDARIHSVLDLGANTGHYARLAAQNGHEVIATDFDPALVDGIFESVQQAGPSLYPAVLDFTHPTPGQGVDSSWFPPAAERLKSDLVLCFALVHHMTVGKYRLDFEQVARGVRSFSRGRVLFEYVGTERLRLNANRPEAETWYTLENMAETLRRHFPTVQILPPAKDGRCLLICGPNGGAA
jgi:SAM-dependent methyltransferase